MYWLLAPLLLAGPAFAAEEILVPFQPPSEVPLPTRAGFVSGKFDSDAKDCHAAGADAIAQLQAAATAEGLPHVIRLVDSRDSRDLSIRTTCKDRHAGKEVVGKSIELLALATAGSDEPGWPTLSGDRAANLLWAVSDLTGRPPAAVVIEGIAGTPGLIYEHTEDLGRTGLELEGRAAWVVNQHVLPPITTWTEVLKPYPELGGALVVAHVRSKDLTGKEKRDERFRVVVRTSEAAAYLEGGLTEQQLTRRAGVYYRPTPKADVEVPLVIDLDAAEAQVADPVAVEERNLGVDERDLGALTDDAP